MSLVVKARIVRIGNSQGVRIPKPLLEQAGLVEDVEVEARGGEIIVRSVRRVRAGWDEQFRLMAERSDSRLLDAPAPTTWDEEEWQW